MELSWATMTIAIPPNALKVAKEGGIPGCEKA